MWQTLIKFGVVGGTGVFVNLGCLALILSTGMNDAFASAIAIEVSIVSNFVLNDRWTFKVQASQQAQSWLNRALRFQLVSMVGASLQWVTFLIFNVLWVYLGVSTDPLADQWSVYQHTLNQGAWHHVITTPPRVGGWIYTSQLIGIGCATLWNFLANYYWTWRSTPSSD